MKTFEAIINIPSPYRVYLFEELANQLKKRGVAFKAHFMAQGHEERPKSWLNPIMHFQYHYWHDFSIKHRHFNPGFIIRSWNINTDVLLVGSPFDTITGILVAFMARARVKCAWVEGQTKTPGKMNGLIGWFKRLVLSQFKYVAVPGHDAIQYMEMHQSLTKRRMPIPIFLPNLIDESRFRPIEMWPINDVIQCRSLFCATDNDRVCIIPARLDVVKGLIPFIEALDAELISTDWKIVIIGQGPLKSHILELARMKGIDEHVIILDYIPYEQMPICYAAADLFLLPSKHDPNPLSVPEALHSGLPIALSDQAGNVEEGVTEGRNGWRLPVNNHEEYKRVLKEVFATSKSKLHEMGILSKNENAQFWNTTKSVAFFIKEVGL